MNIKSLKDIPTSFALAKKAMAICLVTSLALTIGCLSWAFYVTRHFAETAYILTENGQMALAKGISSTEIDLYRTPEIKSHIYTFHRLFWNIDQFVVERNMNTALSMTGHSGKQVYMSLKASGHYSKIKSQNLVQTLQIDSLDLDDTKTPYEAAVYGKLTVKRTDQEKNQKVDLFKATFNLHNVARTDENPHGLLIENYEPDTREMPKKK